MGAQQFDTESYGKTAQEAFDNAVKQAQYDYGHSGYSGTIAEKNSFIVLGEFDNGKDAGEFMEKEFDREGSAVDSEWGPAGCVKIGKDTYAFFGWASS